MSIVDASDSTISPGSATTSPSTPVVPATDTVGQQVQPRVMARQIPSSTARGQMQLGATNIYTDSPGQRIIVQDNSNVPVVSIGNIGTDSVGNTEWGMKVAQAGVDVTTATDSQLIFNSQQNIFKIVKSGTMSITTTIINVGAAHTDSQTVAHNLGYVPAFLYYVDGGFGTVYDPASYGGLTGVSGANQFVGIVDQMNAHADSSNFTISVYNSSFYWGTNPGGPFNVGTTYTFKYYLLQETASPH